MGHDIPPAIRRTWTRADAEADVLAVIKDDTRFKRGLGRHGQVIEHVAHACPRCEHDETVRSKQVNIEARMDVEYWCLNPNCQYFVSDELSWATKPHPQMIPDTPMVWEHTAFCPECEERHTVTVERDSIKHHEVKHQDNELFEWHCDACMESERERGEA